MLQRARSSTDRPSFLGDAVWDALCAQWQDDSFKKKSRQGKLNRSSDSSGFGGSLHTGGSITISQHRANLVNFSHYLYYFPAIFY